MTAGLALLNQNIHCVNANFDAVVASLLDAFHNFPDIVLTETWLSEESAEFCNLDGYNVYHTVHAWHRGGGFVRICSKKFVSKKLLHLCIYNDTIEACVVELVFGDVQLIILSVYRRHSYTISDFDVILLDLLHHHSLTNKNIIITGDFIISSLYLQMNFYC